MSNIRVTKKMKVVISLFCWYADMLQAQDATRAIQQFHLLPNSPLPSFSFRGIFGAREFSIIIAQDELKQRAAFRHGCLESNY